MTVSDLLVKILHAHGIRQVFGIPGDAINDIMESMRTQPEMQFIQVKHEEAGALAASVQAKLTGSLSVCVGTSGPGAIHLLNGLYDAKLDHAPVLAITGQVETQYLGTNYHQEVDLERLFNDVSVYSQTITTESQLPDVLLEACRAALAHRGVAHLSIPSDVAGRKTGIKLEDISELAFAGEVAAASSDCRRAIELINESEKVCILAGIGAEQARNELIAMARKLNAPIVRTLRAKTFIDDTHPLCAGGIGLLGGSPAVKAFDECDTLLMVGTDFPYKEFYPDQANVIQIDINPTQIGKRHPVDVGLVGHAKGILDSLLEGTNRKDDHEFLDRIRDKMDSWQASQQSGRISNDVPIKPQRLVHDISQNAPDNAIYVCDTGTLNAWTARHLHLRENQRYTLSSALGTMGVGLPGAIGAQLAYPDRPVIALCGDGGFSMMMADLITAVNYDLPITVIIHNNQKLGFIALEQEAKGLPAFGIELNNADFVAYAQACGAEGFRVEHPDQLAPTLKQAFSSDKVSVVDVRVDPDELIMPPKIEAGQALQFTKAKLKEWFLNQNN